MPELPLDDVERDTLVGELDRVPPRAEELEQRAPCLHQRLIELTLEPRPTAPVTY